MQWIYIFDAIIQQENTITRQKVAVILHDVIQNIPNNVIIPEIQDRIKVCFNACKWNYHVVLLLVSNSNNLHDKYSIIALSYGLVWTGPSDSSDIHWQMKPKIGLPYFGPSNFNRIGVQFLLS